MDTAIADLETDWTSMSMATMRAATTREFSADTMRRARIALGEYARKVGIYDPVEILAFTQMCIREAERRCDPDTTPDTGAFIARALLVASGCCGLRVPNRGAVMESNESLTESTEAIAAAADVEAAQNFVAIVADQKPIAAVPAAHKRVMPPQPLSELPDVRPTTIWSSCAQTLRRAAMSVVSSVFARSD